MRVAKKSSRSLVVAFGAVLALALWGAPAQAHQMLVYHGSDWARVSSSHFTVTVQDVECDNNGVYSGFTTVGGGFYTVSDPDGCSDNAGALYSPDNTQVASFYVCERNVGCSPTQIVS